jgi:hypothetical protein
VQQDGHQGHRILVGAHRMRLAAGQVDHLVRAQDGGAPWASKAISPFQAQQVISPSTRCSGIGFSFGSTSRISSM